MIGSRKRRKAHNCEHRVKDKKEWTNISNYAPYRSEGQKEIDEYFQLSPIQFDPLIFQEKLMSDSLCQNIKKKVRLNM